MKSYIDVIKDTGSKFFQMNYWTIETTVEQFISGLDEIGMSNDVENRDSVEFNFPYPSLSRTLKNIVPVELSMLDNNVIQYYDITIEYPKDTTHFHLHLYHQDDFHGKYTTERNIPIPLKIIGDKNSADSTWYLYKEIGGKFQWVELDKGTRVTTSTHSIEELKEFKGETLKVDPYLIDLISELLDQKSNNKFLLEIYSNALSDFFDLRLDYDKLVDYFKLGRVFPINFNNYDNDTGKNLNKLFYNVVTDEEFKKVYNDILGA